MKKFKKTFAAVLVGMMILSTVGCGDAAYDYGQALDALENMGDDNSSSSSVKPGKDDDDSTSNVTYADTENQEFEDFLKENFIDSVTADTLDYNYTILDGSKYGIEAPEVATYGDCRMDAAAFDESKEADEEYLEELKAFENAELTEEERFVYECLVEEAEYAMHFYDNIYFYEPFSPGRGLVANLPTNFTEYRFDDKKDIEDYISLQWQTQDLFDPCIQFEYEKSEAGYFVSDATADEIISQCDDFTSETDDHFLIKVFEEKLDKLDWLTEEEKADYVMQSKDAVINGMIPAFESVKETFEDLKGTGTNDKGLYYYDGGADYYANYVYPKFCGSTKSVDEELSWLEAKNTDLTIQLSAIYYSNSDAYDEFCTRYYDEDSLYGDPDVKPDITEVEAMLEGLNSDYLSDFPDIGEIPFEVEYLSDSMESIMENTLAYYMAPAIDDTEHNSIKVNGANTSGIWPTLAHEGCPGHMYQNTYFMQSDPSLGRVLAGNLGYMEGWAEYSKYSIMKYYDFEDTDYDSVFADLDATLTKMGYLMYGIMDIGVNYKGWDEDTVAEKMEEMGYSGEHASELMQTLIDDPGLYLSYSVGYFEMQELHDYAEEELGDKFDIVEYNRCILEAGPCQFTNLKSEVDKFIKENR